MNQDKAGRTYWKQVWSEKININEVDINYYTNNLMHKLYSKYLKKNKNKTICEIGCALSPYLLYFNKYFNYQICGFDYEKESVEKTEFIYQKMGYKANIYYHDFFNESIEKYDILTSFGVFEHFKDLDKSIIHTKKYLKENGIILTVIPNMNGIVGFLQKTLNKKVYDIHIPYTKEDMFLSHERAGYKTLFCDYYGIYQGGVININNIKFENFFRKCLAIPGKPLYYLYKFTNYRFDNKYISPYIIYIGKLK